MTLPSPTVTACRYADVFAGYHQVVDVPGIETPERHLIRLYRQQLPVTWTEVIVAAWAVQAEVSAAILVDVVRMSVEMRSVVRGRLNICWLTLSMRVGVRNLCCNTLFVPTSQRQAPQMKQPDFHAVSRRRLYSVASAAPSATSSRSLFLIPRAASRSYVFRRSR